MIFLNIINLSNRLENRLPVNQYKYITNVFKTSSIKSLITQLSASHFFYHFTSPFQFLLYSHFECATYRAQCGLCLYIFKCFISLFVDYDCSLLFNLIFCHFSSLLFFSFPVLLISVALQLLRTLLGKQKRWHRKKWTNDRIEMVEVA